MKSESEKKMAQYQTFPDAAGDSVTLEKLRALRLPNLSGKRFLDVGCNEGFFCGFADFLGAERVVGLDQSPLFVQRARKRFPRCEFLQQGWEQLPEGPFDVILLASALHYAEDQQALIKCLMERLSPTGTLVLELGIFSSRKAQWKRVKRGIDERLFPSMPMLRKVLAPYAWKWMGPSIDQPGDPVPRHVVHISPRLPLTYLLLQPPGYGKSLIAKELFTKAGVEIRSGDKLLAGVAKGAGEAEVDASLGQCIAEHYSPYQLDRLVMEIFRRGLSAALVDLWLAGTDGKDVAIDAYVPAEHVEEVLTQLRVCQRLPIRLEWERPGAAPLPENILSEVGDAFYLSLLDPESEQRNPRFEPAGFVDEVQMMDDLLLIRGWSVDAAGNLPKDIAVRVAGKPLEMVRQESQLRPDVQQHLHLPHALVGYRVFSRLPDGLAGEALRKGLSVAAGKNILPAGPGAMDDLVKGER